jgi:hypothetical protein
MEPFAHDPAADDKTSRMTKTGVAKALVAGLGAPLVALIAGVSSTSVVDAWEDDEPYNLDERRDDILRDALRALLILSTRFDSAVAQRWFVGTNSLLGGNAPSEVLRRSLEERGTGRYDGQSVAAAARSFVHT